MSDPADPRPAEPDDLEIFDAPPAEAEPGPVALDARIAHPALRALAFAIDGIGTVAATILVVMGAFVAGQPWFFLGVIAVPLLSATLATVLTALRGITPGKAIVGIRVVGVATGRPPGPWAILRSLVIVSPLLVTYAALWMLSATGQLDSAVLTPFWLPVTLWIGLLVILALHPRHRGLQDLAGRSLVVRR